MTTAEDMSTAFRLSPQQERLWSLGAGIHAQLAVELRGPVDEARLRNALEQSVGRHEILRTTFARHTGMRLPYQVVRDVLPPAWATRNAEGADVQEVLAQEAQRRVDLSGGPLVDALMLHTGPNLRLFTLTIPILCADVVSLFTLLDELRVLYEEGNEHPLPEAIQYADYAEWRRELLATDDEQAAAGRLYWAAADGLCVPQPPILFAQPPTDVGESERRFAPVEGLPEYDVLLRAAATRRVEPALFLEACWHALLRRLGGASVVCVGAGIDGRRHAELVRAIGAFAQSLPIASTIESDTTFPELVEQIRWNRERAESQQDYQPVDAASPHSGFTFASCDPVSRLGDADVSVQAVRGPVDRQALALTCRSIGSRLDVELAYDPGEHADADADQVAASFATLVSAAVREPNVAVNALPLLEEPERIRLTTRSGMGTPRFPDRTVHDLFALQAHRTPDLVALVAGGERMTYAELDDRATRLADGLRAQGVGPGDAVGLCVPRSVDSIVGLIGILKADAAFVPLNPEHPSARLLTQLGQAEAAAVVTCSEFADRFIEFDGPLIGSDVEFVPLGDRRTLAGRTRRPGIAYVMYTSGSAGAPKGAAITHRNLVNYATYVIGRLGADQAALSFATVSALSTDLCNTCVFPSLLSGGTLHLVDFDTAMDGRRLAAYFGEHPIDVLKITPSHLRALLTACPGGEVLPLRWLVMGGEALGWDFADELLDLGGCGILNHYGPTETTVGACTYDVVRGALRESATVPVGYPIANVSTYVLDELLEPVPEGVPGELCIGGAGVSEGYVGSREQTEERFVGNPFAPDADARMYRTGDRARILHDGSIEFLGRIDDQVKIRGYRVEPREVEAVLASHADVRQAAVVADSTKTEPRLVAFVVGSVGVDDLTSHTRAFLPDYMHPAEIIRVERLPLTPSGKVDRRALATEAQEAEKQYVAPRSDLEAELAALWAEILGDERVGIEDDFFSLGGHSLMATQLVARLRHEYGVDVPFQALFATPTVAGLAAVIEELRVTAAEHAAVDEVLAELGVSVEELRMTLGDQEPRL